MAPLASTLELDSDSFLLKCALPNLKSNIRSILQTRSSGWPFGVCSVIQSSEMRGSFRCYLLEKKNCWRCKRRHIGWVHARRGRGGVRSLQDIKSNQKWWVSQPNKKSANLPWIKQIFPHTRFWINLTTDSNVLAKNLTVCWLEVNFLAYSKSSSGVIDPKFWVWQNLLFWYLAFIEIRWLTGKFCMDISLIHLKFQ